MKSIAMQLSLCAPRIGMAYISHLYRETSAEVSGPGVIGGPLNKQRSDGPLTEDPSLWKGFSLLKQPSRSSTLGEELIQMERYVHLAKIADGKTAASDNCRTTLVGSAQKAPSKRAPSEFT